MSIPKVVEIQKYRRQLPLSFSSPPATNGEINREISRPEGLWKYEYVWMLAETPSENIRARTRRAHDKNWLVGWHGSGRIHLLLVVEHRSKTIYVAKRILFDGEVVPWNKLACDQVHYGSFES